MRVKLDKVYISEVEAELPERCKCGADLSAKGALMEDQLMATSQECAWTPDGPDGHGEIEDSDAIYVTGYSCAGCKTVLVTSEERAPEYEDRRAAAGDAERDARKDRDW